MIVVNLFAGPGAGKSTTAAGLFYELKRRGINAELVTEFAKDLTWESRHETMKDQVYITAKQNRRLERLRGKVDIVITDSPLLFGIHYMSTDHYLFETYTPLVLKLFDSYTSLNFLIPRKPLYMQVGRSQTKEEAITIDGDIEDLLRSLNISHTKLTCDVDDVVEIILKDILTYL